MRFSRFLNKFKTPQFLPIPGSAQAPNSAGGYSFEVDPWKKLDRFLILGTEGGTYYVSEVKLTMDQCANLVELIQSDGKRVVEQVQIISGTGRAPRNGPALFALAAASALGDTETRQAAFAAVPTVCRTGTHLFEFVAEASQMRGWGRAMRRAVGNWYQEQPVEELTYQAIKYQNRSGWSHRDLLRLAHPRPATEGHKALFKWIVDGERPENAPENSQLDGFLAIKKSATESEAARLIETHKLPRECVPTEFLKSPSVWMALLKDMPLTAMIRNLANMTRCGLLAEGSDAAGMVVRALQDPARLKRARIHPVGVLLAHATYAGGTSAWNQSEFRPVKSVVDALHEAFFAAFPHVEASGKRHMLALDVSGSMSASWVAHSPLSAAMASTAMALVTARVERECHTVAFSDSIIDFTIADNSSLDSLMKRAAKINFGWTDCAAPMVHAAKRKIPVDVFVVYTDSETWAGEIHPVQALDEYRQRMGIAAKMVVVGMCSNGFTIANPADPGMLDVVGFDAVTPQAIREFSIA